MMSSSLKVLNRFFKDSALPQMANVEFGALRTGTKKEKIERGRTLPHFRISGWRGNINSILCGL